MCSFCTFIIAHLLLYIIKFVNFFYKKNMKSSKRDCLKNPNVFSYICGEYTLCKSKIKKITNFEKTTIISFILEWN